MSDERWCRHYNGVGRFPNCEIGIAYETVRDTSERPFRWACTEPDLRGLCASFEPHTAEEIEESEKAVANYLTRLSAFSERKSTACPICGTEAAALEQVGRCVYVRSCGCRLWQGTIPAAWRIEEGTNP